MLLAATVLTACDKKDGNPSAAAVAPAVAAPAPAGAATPAGSAVPSSTAIGATASAATTASAGGVPAECDDYIHKVNSCMDKLGANSPAVATFRQQLEASRTQWATVQDKTALAAQCKQSTDLFTQSASQMGCQ
ncbi:glutaconyl-CoA decarboxylase subunit gamma [Achromobacter sp. HZ28]|nr:glutaconyl-CoA decarboxylase subunit gamma [Achromobacter sp. HZ28]OWT77947.1 glutaconyl-CoA decarboxylase subunit gamma [Achromobacter sp. HZ34]